ncbi:hypothetical protein R0799_21170, partial [Escherichia coli]
QNDVTLKMPAFEWVHVQLHQQKGMISLSPPTICNSAFSSASDDHCRNFCTIFWERDFTPTQPALFVQPVLRAIPDF